MTTVVQFTPPARGAFSFTATLDGNQYLITVPWNVQAQRFYVTCSGPNNTIIFTLPLIGSPDCLPLSSITSNSYGLATVTTQNPHSFPIGSMLKLLFFGQSPSAYSGMQLCAVTSATTLAFQLADNPPPNVRTSVMASPTITNEQGQQLTDEYGDAFVSEFPVVISTIVGAAATTAGFCKQVMNMAGGYFQTSIMEYWASAGQFVIIP